MKRSNHLFYCFFISLIFLSQAFSDYKETTPVGPGVTYYHEFRATGPWHFHVLEIDLTNPWLHLQTAKANDLLAGYERTSSMSARNDRDGHRVIGAVNADFYLSGGIPTNAQVCEGVLLKQPINREVFGCSDQNELFIAITSFLGKILSKDTLENGINGINEVRGENKLIVYNKYYGDRTQTNIYGTEITATYLSTPIVNDTLLLAVADKDSLSATGHGNNIIPKNGVILSGHGIMKTYLDSAIFVGDTIRIILNLTPVTCRIKELIGGNPTIIRNGVKDVPDGSFSSDRHPRTAIGFNQDTTRLYFVVVDGRQPEFSIGMSLYELADYMLEWNVYRGVNLDGGGSSTMVVRNQVKNSPSDAGGERTVANSLMLISTAPTSSLNHLRITPREIFLLRDSQKQFAIAGYDEYWNPVTIPSAVQWTSNDLIGSIDANGLFTTGADTGTGFLFATLDDIVDSVIVHITDITTLVMTPDPVILQVGEQQQMSVKAYDNYSNKMDIDADAYTWTVSGAFGEISASGLFSASQAGEGFIRVAYGNVADSVAVTIGSSTTVLVDDFSSVSNWSVSGTLVTISECSITADNTTYVSVPTSGRLNYSLATGGTSSCNLTCSIPISGTPSSIGIWVYGDGQGHWLRGEFKDKDNEKFLMDFTSATPGIDWSDAWRFMEAQLENAIPSWANPSAVLTYPITWSRFYIAETNDTKKGSGTLYFDDFSVNFIAAGIKPDSKNLNSRHFSLLGNYPNPFNSTTNFRVRIEKPGDLRMLIFDLNGRAVGDFSYNDLAAGDRTLSWQAENCPTGIYLYQFKMNDQNLFGKCVMIK